MILFLPSLIIQSHCVIYPEFFLFFQSTFLLIISLASQCTNYFLNKTKYKLYSKFTYEKIKVYIVNKIYNYNIIFLNLQTYLEGRFESLNSTFAATKAL